MFNDTFVSELELALALHQQGQLPQALSVYQRLLAQQPHNEDVVYLYSVLASQLGHYDIAIPIMQRMVTQYPQVAALHLNLGQAYQGNRQLAEARTSYEQALALEPDLAEAHHNLASLLLKTEQWLSAQAHLTQALQLRPHYPEAWYNLGLWHERNDEPDAAQSAYEQAVTYKPNYTKAWNRLGILFHQKHQWRQAKDCYQQAQQGQPEDAESYHNLGVLLAQQGDYEAALIQFQQALQLNPNEAATWYHLGYAHHMQQNSTAAVVAYEKALSLQPDYAEAWYNLGLLQQSLGQSAAESLQTALTLHFRPGDVCFNLGLLCQKWAQPDQAKSWFDRAIAHYQEHARQSDPGDKSLSMSLGFAFKAKECYEAALDSFKAALPDLQAHCEYGHTLYLLKRYDEAYEVLDAAQKQGCQAPQMYITLSQLSAFCGDSQAQIDYLNQALSLVHDDADLYLMLLFALHGQPGITPAALKTFYRQWEEQYIQQWYPAERVFTNIPNPYRRLRIGYMSGDFCGHSAAAVFEVLFQLHDRRLFELHAYSMTPRDDATTAWFQEKATYWNDATQWSDDILFQHIQNDHIDILVDLSGLTAGQRLRMLARKPAPIQITGLGFGSTTGVASIDYAFTDPYLVTPASQSLYCEKLYGLRSLICWTPNTIQFALQPQMPIHPTSAQIVLGCGNASFKINQTVMALWAQILHAIPEALIHLKTGAFDHQITKDSFCKTFQQQGIERQRILFSGATQVHQHMEFYNQIDIALDPFPYNGGITTCETLWMGVPVVTLGNQSLNRAGVSILSQVGHPEWIARDEADYINLVIELAQQLEKRSQLRIQLRQEMMASPLCDAVGFVREIEAAYYQMWHQWCHSKGGGG